MSPTSKTQRNSKIEPKPSKTIATVIAQVRNEPVPESFFTDRTQKITAEPISSGIVFHHPGLSCRKGTPYTSKILPELSVQEVSLDELAAASLCPGCWSGKALERHLRCLLCDWYQSANPPPLKQLALLYRVAEIKRRLNAHIARLSSPGKAPTNSSTTRLINEAEGPTTLVLKFASVHNQFAKDLLRSLQETTQQLRKATQSSSEQINEILIGVQTALTPSWWKSAPRQVDNTQCLMAIYPVPELTATQTVAKSAIRTLVHPNCTTSGAKTAKTLLLLPRYVAEYLQGIIGDLPSIYLSTMAVPDNAQTIEVAFALWQPDGQSDLQDFPRALEVAAALEQPNPE